MIQAKDKLRMRMLSYASRLLAQGINKRNLYMDDPAGSPDSMVAHAQIEIARELLDILNDTGDPARRRSPRVL